MSKGTSWEYQSASPENQRKFDRWLNANAVLSLFLALGMLAMAVAAITTGPKSSNVAAGVSDQFAGRESAGVKRDSRLVPVMNRQPSR